MKTFYMNDSKRNNGPKYFSFLVGMTAVISIFFVGNTVAAEYVSLTITPHNVGVFYQNETQQFTAIGTTASGDTEDITDEVDWYIDPEGYPHNDQDTTPGAVATIDETGLATVHDTWGRVVVYACYPKGCGPNNSQALSYVIGSLLRPSYTVSSDVDGTDDNGAISAGKTVKQNSSASFTLTPTDNDYEASSVDTDCPVGTFANNNTTYTTGGITEDCSVTAHFTAKPTVESSVTDGNGTVSLDGVNPYYTGQPAEFTLSPDSGYQVSTITDTCGGGNGTLSSDKLTYSTEDISANCTVDFQFALIPTYTLTVTATRTGVQPGIVTSDPVGITCDTELATDCTEIYNDGTSVTLSADTLGSVSWTDCVSPASTDSEITITMDSDKTCTATFGD